MGLKRVERRASKIWTPCECYQDCYIAQENNSGKVEDYAGETVK